MRELPDRSIKISVDRGGTFTDVHASWPQVSTSSPSSSASSSGERTQVILKLLSSDPTHYSDAPREGVRRMLQLATGHTYSREELLPVDKIDSIRLSTTVATNALLERQGAKHALVVTKGFGSLLEIGNQSRPRIFDLDIKRPSVLYSSVIEVDERVTLVGYTSDPKRAERAVRFDEQGQVEKGYDDEHHPPGSVVKGWSGEAVQILKKPDEQALKTELQKLYDEGYRSLAIVLMHSFTYPGAFISHKSSLPASLFLTQGQSGATDHERQIESIAQSIGFEHISLSSASLPMIRIVARGTSCTVDAYLTPVLLKYIDGFFSGFEPSLRETNQANALEPTSTSPEEPPRTTSVEFMRSDGGLTDVRGFSGLKSILSGPAGGVVGFALTSWQEGGKAVIGLDMGGTSTDVTRFDGTYETVFETTTAGVTIQSPQLNINTVAAGGGSRLFWRNGLFVTGPESAGSDPGPSCYRKGGEPAITDANLVLGRLLPNHFPKIFGEKEDQGLDVEASTKALEKLREEINQETGKDMSLDQVAWGFIKVANETMCRPIRSLTEARGYDTSKHVLSCFGGAGGQHACAIASTLGISTILIHHFSSILSAYGMALAERVVERQEPSSEQWFTKGASERLEARLKELGQQAHRELSSQGFSDERIEIHPYLHMRYNGTDSALMIHRPSEHDDDYAKAFAQAYEQEFGFSMNAEITIDDVRVRGVGKSFDSLGPSVWDELGSMDFREIGGETGQGEDRSNSKCDEMASVYFESQGRVDVPVFLLDRLEKGDLVKGPAMIIDGTQTVVVDPGATARLTSKHIVIELAKK
ncbi:BZ3500_MvSof-1268-A1-R1_Chr4-3g07328 [Microbotryum saponariae]|uniref:BZ3500_MvSof-1268-A1-R1_Chr4-3g07328 protein n=1 Tax=Microbotryum saponariae TaxID=289078 RepID=A0A2X0LN86_9BASI|nr:BZ3500_MvSof-1268-A1-R1_Chr4-3g07328 [Microbotryum saponariae]SDA06991.1 BZ3501_MvSof-1269-A2-R1_Chr4-2g07037 [Microbotryum saponariae]